MIDNERTLNIGESRPFYSQVDAGSGCVLTIPAIGGAGQPTWVLYLGDPSDNVVAGSGNADVIKNNGAQKPQVGVWIDARGTGGSTGIATPLVEDTYTLVITYDAQGTRNGTAEVKPRHYSRRITLKVE